MRFVGAGSIVSGVVSRWDSSRRDLDSWLPSTPRPSSRSCPARICTLVNRYPGAQNTGGKNVADRVVGPDSVFIGQDSASVFPFDLMVTRCVSLFEKRRTNLFVPCSCICQTKILKSIEISPGIHGWGCGPDIHIWTKPRGIFLKIPLDQNYLDQGPIHGCRLFREGRSR